jgi:5'-3' exonuclease
MTLLIDADWLLYSACAANECDIRWDEWTHTLHLEQGDVKDYISSRLSFWRDVTLDNDLILCFSDYPTFRHEIHQEYKANRLGKRKPLGIRDLRIWMEQSYPARTYTGLEADDVLGLLATSGTLSNPIVISPDKDMRTVPCQILVNDQIEVIHPVDANRAWMTQVLTGDSTDNYQGLKGFGPVTAAKTLADAITLPELWDKVVGAYKKAGRTYSDAVHMARLSRILRHGDYDFDTSTIKLWEPDTDPLMKVDQASQ